MAGGDVDGAKAKFLGQSRGAVNHQDAACLDDYRLPGFGACRLIHRLQRGVILGARASGIARGPVFHCEIMLRVENRLARDCDNTHEALGVIRGGRKGEVLESFWLENQPVGVSLAQKSQRAAAAVNALGGDEIGGGETQLAQLCQRLGVWRKLVGHPKMRPHLGDLIAWSGIAHVRLGGGYAGKIYPGARVNGLGPSIGDRLGLCVTQREIWIDETGINRLA